MRFPFLQSVPVGSADCPRLHQRWIPELAGLRCVAIAAVFLFHLSIELTMRSGRVVPVGAGSQWLLRIVSNGDRGVDLFFVLSGLVVGLPFARHWLLAGPRVRLGNFFWRRLTRLEIPFLVSVGISVLMVLVWGHGMEPSAGSVLATATYLHGAVYGAMAPFDVVTWSLEVEVQFYLLAPLLMQWYRVRSVGLRRGSIMVGILALGLAQVPFAGNPRVHLSALYFLQYFLAGMLVADWLVLREDSDGNAESRPNLWDAAGVVALGGMFWVSKGTEWLHVVVPLVGAVVCASAVRGEWLGRVLQSRGVVGLGGMSYAIYLLHFQLMAAVFKVTRVVIEPSWGYGLNLVVQMVVTGIPVLALCWAFFMLVERPCLDAAWRRQVWGWLGSSGSRRSIGAMRGDTV